MLKDTLKRAKTELKLLHDNTDGPRHRNFIKLVDSLFDEFTTKLDSLLLKYNDLPAHPTTKQGN